MTAQRLSDRRRRGARAERRAARADPRHVGGVVFVDGGNVFARASRPGPVASCAAASASAAATVRRSARSGWTSDSSSIDARSATSWSRVTRSTSPSARRSKAVARPACGSCELTILSIAGIVLARSGAASARRRDHRSHHGRRRWPADHAVGRQRGAAVSARASRRRARADPLAYALDRLIDRHLMLARGGSLSAAGTGAGGDHPARRRAGAARRVRRGVSEGAGGHGHLLASSCAGTFGTT